MIKKRDNPLTFRVHDHVVKNLIQAYITVTDSMFAAELRGQPLNWSGDNLVFDDNFNDEFDQELDREN